MKLQLQPQRLRVRISEAELARLLGGETLRFGLAHAGSTLLEFAVRLGEVPASARVECSRAPGGDARWQLTLPEPVVRAYAGTLPRRDALVLEVGRDEGPDSLRAVSFEVDVRDSLVVRGTAQRRAMHDA